MINDIKYANAMAEVLYYLKGIRNEDLAKIPKKLIDFLEENSNKNYICNFDYTKPLKELNLTDESKGIIAMICYYYWCNTEENKQKLISIFNQNEKIYQEEMKEKYDPKKIFEERNEKNIQKIKTNETVDVVKYKESKLKKIINKLKNYFHIR